MIYGYVYGLRNKITNKWYIGQTTQEPMSYIVKTYKNLLGGRRVKIHDALKKYGFENFETHILYSESNKEDLDLKEIKTITEKIVLIMAII